MFSKGDGRLRGKRGRTLNGDEDRAVNTARTALSRAQPASVLKVSTHTLCISTAACYLSPLRRSNGLSDAVPLFVALQAAAADAAALDEAIPEVAPPDPGRRDRRTKGLDEPPSDGDDETGFHRKVSRTQAARSRARAAAMKALPIPRGRGASGADAETSPSQGISAAAAPASPKRKRAPPTGPSRNRYARVREVICMRNVVTVLFLPARVYS